MHLDLIPFVVITILIVLAPYASRLFRLPLVAVEIILGAIASYFGILQHTVALEVIAEMSFLYLMFLAGMELDLRSFKDVEKKFYTQSLIYFIVLYTSSVIIIFIFNLPSVYIAMLATMSLGVLMTLIKDYGKDKEWLNLALKIGIAGELISIVALVLVNNGYSYSLVDFEFYKTLFILFIFILTIAIIFRIGKLLFWWMPSIKLWFMPSNDSNNQDIRFSFMLFFVLVGITAFLHLELVLGAFLAGVIVATFFSYKHDMVHKLNDIGFGFFIPLFFVYVGSTLNIRMINLDIIVFAIYLMIAMFFIRFLSSIIAFKSCFNLKNIFLFSLSSSIPLTFLVAIASLALKLDVISESEYYALILTSMFEGILFVAIIKALNVKESKKENP